MRKKFSNQVVDQEGRLCDLWAEFKEHSKLLYMAHHAVAKWQRNCHWDLLGHV